MLSNDPKMNMTPRGGGAQNAKKSVTKFLCVNTVSNKVVRHLLVYLSVQKWFAGSSLLREIWPKPSNPFKHADFQSIFARSALAVTSSDKS